MDLERELHHALRQLPAPRAPGTLRPRILAAIAREASRPWYMRSFWTWPQSLQTAAAVVACAVIGAGALVLTGIVPLGTALAAAGREMPGWLVAISDALAATTVIVRTVWRLLVLPAATLAFVLVLVTALTSALGWSTLSRLALGGATRP
jgi:hypothetical protein